MIGRDEFENVAAVYNADALSYAEWEALMRGAFERVDVDLDELRRFANEHIKGEAALYFVMGATLVASVLDPERKVLA